MFYFWCLFMNYANVAFKCWRYECDYGRLKKFFHLNVSNSMKVDEWIMQITRRCQISIGKLGLAFQSFSRQIPSINERPSQRENNNHSRQKTKAWLIRFFISASSLNEEAVEWLEFVDFSWFISENVEFELENRRWMWWMWSNLILKYLNIRKKFRL